MKPSVPAPHMPLRALALAALLGCAWLLPAQNDTTVRRGTVVTPGTPGRPPQPPATPGKPSLPPTPLNTGRPSGVVHGGGNAVSPTWTGILNLNQHKPPQGPVLEITSVKWRASYLESGAYALVLNMNWYLGATYRFEGRDIPTERLQDVLPKVSLQTIVIAAEAHSAGRRVSVQQFNLGATPPHGGTWGAEIQYTLAPGQLFPGLGADSALKLFNKGFELKALTLRTLAFGGLNIADARVRELESQARYADLMAAGERALQAQDYEAAARNFEQALGVMNTPEAREKATLANYDGAMYRGERAMANGDFGNAIQFFQQALTVRITPLAQERLALARYAMPMRDGDVALANRDYERAARFYEDALQIRPTPEARDRAANARYLLHMSAGDRAFGAQNFREAMAQYEAASRFAPTDPAAKEGMARAQAQIRMASEYEALVPQLEAKYAQKMAEARRTQEEFRARAVKASNYDDENCLIRQMELQACEEGYLKQKAALVRDEARYQVYGDQSLRDKAQISNPCRPMDCRTLSESDNAGFTSAQNYDLAQHKYEVWQRLRDEAFRRRAQELTALAIQQNPRNIAALIFSTTFTEDLIQKMVAIDKAMGYESRNPEAVEARRRVYPQFCNELYDRIAQGSVQYVNDALRAGLVQNAALAEVRAEATPERQAVAHDQDAILEMLLNARKTQGISPAAPAELQDLLDLAAKRNKPKSAAVLLAFGADPNKRDNAGLTALDYATLNNANGVVAAFLKKGGGSDVSGPLLAATRDGKADIVKTFLEAKADANTTDRTTGSSLLLIALEKQYHDLAQLLLEYKANPNHENLARQTPLMLAARARHPGLLTQLLDRQADPAKALAALQGEGEVQYLAEHVFWYAYARRSNELMQLAQSHHPRLALAPAPGGTTPAVVFALSENRLPACEVLLQSDIAWDEPIGGEYFLLRVIEARADALVQPLVRDKHVSLSVRNTRKQQSALHLAVAQGNTALAQFLVDSGHLLDARDIDLKTPLHLALEAGHIDIARYLIEHGANIRLADTRGAQPIHVAAMKRQGILIEQMLDRGGDVNAPGPDGMTALHFAARVGDVPLIKVLVARGANKALRDSAKRTPAKVAKLSKQREAAKELAKK